MGLLEPYRGARLWLRTIHLLVDLVLGVVFFTVVVTAVSTAFGLILLVVGLPLLAITVVSGRLVGVVERWRSRVFLGAPPPPPARFRLTGGWVDQAKQTLGDRPGWRGLVYGVLLLPWGVLTFTVTVTLWSLTLGLLTAPVWLALPYEDEVLDGWWRVAAAGGGVVLGVGLAVLLPLVVAGLAELDRRLIFWLLTPSREDELIERVETLQASRDASVEGSASELRRIERDLHDGAQQRLVSLAMNLGLAKDQLERSSADVDPRTVSLVTEAHDEAKLAIAELRDLVRGIHPAVLTDRGLDAAVSAVAARCAVPVTLRSELVANDGSARRFPAPVEAAAYFIVAEALTNVTKHSRARSATVVLREQDDHLVVEIHDDGVGGAAEGSAGGLRNLRDRVAGAEGRLRIASPSGGPTVIIAELPCGS